MSSTATPIAFVGSTLHEYRHLCAFFNTPAGSATWRRRGRCAGGPRPGRYRG
jgi:hypothetical protein